jgi:hypothetical protein
MRIALAPLDSRPPNWLFPQRLADIAGIELALPPRKWLGTLHHGADGRRLAAWLADTVTGADGRGHCDAAVFAWDALLYGGLVQSRDPERPTAGVADIARELSRVDWSATAGYAYITVPRLGITVDSNSNERQHQLVRDYFIEWGKDEEDALARQRLFELAGELGEKAVRQLWQWRERNHGLAVEALHAAVTLGLRRCHVAVEDNAPTGPHLREEALLMQASTEARQAGGVNLPHCTSFDGADECACLLLAKAVADARLLPRLRVQLLIHPVAPGPDRYVGLYESHPLGDGLTFLGNLLGFDYTYGAGAARWLVVHGVQPQPDVFASDPGRVFANPYLLPKHIESGGALHVSDLAACNGANPHLPGHLTTLAPEGLRAFVGFNTNFNTLGVSAAWLRLSAGEEASAASRRFLVERLADDAVYQSIARPKVLQYLRAQQLGPFDFAEANRYQLSEIVGLVRRAWDDWRTGLGQAALAAAGITPGQAAAVEYSFPWLRAFETEVTAPLE